MKPPVCAACGARLAADATRCDLCGHDRDAPAPDLAAEDIGDDPDIGDIGELDAIAAAAQGRKKRARVIIDVRLGERSPTVDAALCLLFRESGGKPPAFHSLFVFDVVCLLSRVCEIFDACFGFSLL